MTKINIKSVLEIIAAQVFIMTDLTAAQQYITTFINERGINDKDKLNIMTEVKQSKSLIKLQHYLCNALLKYEGMGMNKINKTAKQDAVEQAEQQ
jgi:hypothetical protein